MNVTVSYSWEIRRDVLGLLTLKTDRKLRASKSQRNALIRKRRSFQALNTGVWEIKKTKKVRLLSRIKSL
jgi:hypothetical protein